MYQRSACILGLLSLAAVVASCSDPAPSQPSAAAKDPARAHALQNVHAINDTIMSGAAPEGDAAFEELRARGIRTIISVDGSAPDVATAAAHGLRYVHIPITYAEVTDSERAEIARAVRDLPGPVYIHCHHGQHRGPAAAAAAAISLGEITPEQGVAFLKLAGTAPSYQGLYACVASATPLPASVIDAAPDEFPAVHTPRGLVAAMVDADVASDHLAAIRRASWNVPSDHPDLVPASEAGQLADALRFARESPRAKSHGPDFERRLADALGLATALEDAIVAGEPAARLDGRYRILSTACNDCHAVYRNKPEH